MNSTITVKNR